jgi:hypothetical protein
MMEPVGSARRRVMRSERPLRSILACAETRDTPSTSNTHVSGEKTKGVMGLTGGNKMPFGGEATGDERIDGGSTRPTEEIT